MNRPRRPGFKQHLQDGSLPGPGGQPRTLLLSLRQALTEGTEVSNEARPKHLPGPEQLAGRFPSVGALRLA